MSQKNNKAKKLNNLNYKEKLFDIENFNKWLITFVPISIIF